MEVKSPSEECLKTCKQQYDDFIDGLEKGMEKLIPEVESFGKKMKEIAENVDYGISKNTSSNL